MVENRAIKADITLKTNIVRERERERETDVLSASPSSERICGL